MKPSKARGGVRNANSIARGEMSSRAAFTLVELLTVTAIISILMAIVGTTLAKTKADAKKAACAFNLRQMGVGVGEYIIDYDDIYPQTKGHTSLFPATDDASGSIELPDRGSPLSKLGRYGVSIAECPADADPDGLNCDSAVSSYLVNGYFVWGLGEPQVTSTADTVYMAERRSVRVGSTPEYCDTIYRPWYNPSNLLAPQNDMDPLEGAIATRHFDGANYEFADGHAAWRVFTTTWSPATGVDHHTP